MARLFFRALALALVLGGILGGCALVGLLGGVFDDTSWGAWKNMARAQGVKSTLLEFALSFTVDALLLLICLPIGVILWFASSRKWEEEL